LGGQDRTVPEASTKSMLKQSRHSDAATELAEFRDRGRCLAIDSGWRTVADELPGWPGK
jgi:non-heme chloroperoxidase